MDRAYAALGRTSHDFWNRRASQFHAATRDTVLADPLWRRLRRVVSRRTTVLDVGAGTGRFSLALAPLVERVVAVEPNEAMRGILEREAQTRGLGNLQVVPTTWQAAPDALRADVVVCSHVLYPIGEIEPFLAKLHAAARRHCFVYVRAVHPDTVMDPLWRHFHGEPRRIGPTYVAAVDVLAEMQPPIFADVQVVSHQPTFRYGSLDEAVEQLLETLILPDTPGTQAELRRLLAGFLVERDGALTLPAEDLPNAIVHWKGAHAAPAGRRSRPAAGA